MALSQRGRGLDTETALGNFCLMRRWWRQYGLILGTTCDADILIEELNLNEIYLPFIYLMIINLYLKSKAIPNQYSKSVFQIIKSELEIHLV